MNIKTSLTALAAATLTACGTSHKSLTDQATPVADATTSADVPAIEEEYLYLSAVQQQLVEQNNTFAINLFQKTCGRTSSVVSPLSVTYLMVMLADGADGQTRSEMLATLGWQGAQADDIDALCRLLMDKSGRLDPSTTLHLANYIALNRDARLRDDYVQATADNFHAAVESLDFSSSAATQRINSWCARHTDGMIPSIIDRTDPSAALYAMNAIFFNGSWADKFNKKLTREENFRGYTRDIQRVQMMHRTGELLYTDNDTLQAVSLPYGNGAYEMLVVLPKEGLSAAEAVGSLTATRLSELRWAMDNCRVDLSLPRFTTEQSTDLNDIISQLGAPSMFSPSAADFSRMSPQALHVSKMLQKAKIEVTEEGTRAAAVTAAVMMLTSLEPREPRHVTFRADHPFAYLIIQRASGAVLFMGQYAGENEKLKN